MKFFVHYNAQDQKFLVEIRNANGSEAKFERVGDAFSACSKMWKHFRLSMSGTNPVPYHRRSLKPNMWVK